MVLLKGKVTLNGAKEYNDSIYDDEWKHIYTLPFVCSGEIKTQMFQYKINMKCLMTNSKLFKMNIVRDNKRPSPTKNRTISIKPKRSGIVSLKSEYFENVLPHTEFIHPSTMLIVVHNCNLLIGTHNNPI